MDLNIRFAEFLTVRRRGGGGGGGGNMPWRPQGHEKRARSNCYPEGHNLKDSLRAVPVNYRPFDD